MGWSNAMTLEFLRLYQRESAIWNPHDKNHKSRSAVSDGWRRIQRTFKSKYYDVSIPDLKKKKESLMATFRPLLQKVNASKASGREDAYKPNWFAFDLMYKFLSSIYQPRQIPNPQEVEYVLKDDEPSDTEEIDDNASPLTITENRTENQGQTFNSPFGRESTKRKFYDLQRVENHVEDSYSLMSSACDRLEKDECSIYAELLATKLRKFDENTREILMHEIDNLIFKARRQNRINTTATDQELQNSNLFHQQHSRSVPCAQRSPNHLFGPYDTQLPSPVCSITSKSPSMTTQGCEWDPLSPTKPSQSEASFGSTHSSQNQNESLIEEIKNP